MVVLLSAEATPEQVSAVCAKVEALGFKSHTVAMSRHITVAINGKTTNLERAQFLSMPGVVEVSRVTVPYRLAGLEVQPEPTILSFPGHESTIGGTELAIIAGPCSIESREQAFAIAVRVARAGARFFRLGVL